MHLHIRPAAAILVAVAVGTVAAQPAPPDEHFILRVRVVDKATEIPRLAEMQLDLAGVDVKTNTADFVGDQEAYEALQAAGFFPEIVWSSSAQPAVEALSQYIDPAEAVAAIDFYVSTYPALAKKVAISTTVEGRTEWALKISDNVTVEEDEPVVLYFAQHHAREVMTPEIAFDIVEYLLTRYATDARVRNWVDEREIWVVPNHNPDGTNTVFTGTTMWRKNRRPNGGGVFGVEPNRNYPFLWTFCSSGQGASSSPSSDLYRGPSPASEPETQGIMQLARDHRPVVSISYHTYSELMIHPYGCVETVSSELRLLRDHTSDMAARTRNDANDGWYISGTPWELLYEVSGGSDEWLYGEVGVIATTLEANSYLQGFQPDYDTWRESTLLRNRPAWQYLLDRIDGPSIWGHVTDACTGAPLSATIGLDEIVFTHGETPRTSEPGYGRYQRLTVPGSYHLRVSKSGYGTQVRPVDVDFEAVQRDIHLVPTGSFSVAVAGTTIEDLSADGDGQIDPGESVTLAVAASAGGGAVSGLTGVLQTSDPYVTITDANGSWPAIGAGGTALSTDGFGLSVSPSAPDGHVVTFTLTFSSAESLCDPVASFELRVRTLVHDCPLISQPLDTNPGWTIQNSVASGWAFGVPASGGVGGPSSAHTGANVYGTNLTGNYGNSADYRLITTAFDLSGFHGTELRFWRWLSTEPGYDIATVAVSTDGISFTNVWSGFGHDTAWTLYRYDISAIADDHATVYVRFRLQSDSTTVLAGFYVDDVSICGETSAAAPRLAVESWNIADDAAACADHDSFADPGETVDLTLNIRNVGTSAAHGVVARLSTSDPRIGVAEFRAPLGIIPADAAVPASFQVSIPSDLPCRTSVPLRVDFEWGDGIFAAFDASVVLTASGDQGSPVPDTFEDFDPPPPNWTLTGEWQVGVPQGKGGTANGGSGSPDPAFAPSGTKVLGLDLSGLGSLLGSYEHGLTVPATATSPPYNCAQVSNVQLSFWRWLGTERNSHDQATIDVWDGNAWQTLWQNPDATLSDSLWQAVSYDVSPWAAGNPAFQVRFKMASDASIAYCGWNIDDIHLTNAHISEPCEAAPCAAGCTPTTQAQDLRLGKTGDEVVADWGDGADACLAAAGARYRVYRGVDARPRTEPPTQWPADSYFTDVTTLDLDGTSSNTSYSDADLPSAGAVLYYLVVPMGTNGQEGPKGWQGF